VESGHAVGDADEVELHVSRAAERDRPVLRRLLELYSYDFSEFDDRDLDADGEYGYRYLDDYWADSDRHPFLLRVNGQIAGLVLVRAGAVTDMAEFFVLRKYRRLGVGRRAAEEVFRMFPGRWTVRQKLTNPAATAFWRSVIPYPFAERTSGEEVIQEFTAR
jgi:predicted acetyltransferase